MLTMLTTALFLTASSPVPASDAAAAPAPEVWLLIGSGVEDREIVPLGEGETLRPGDTAFAWMLLKGFDGDAVEHVWTRDGVEVARHALSIGSPKRWRSWSHMRVRAGHYEVRVVGPDGAELARQELTVVPAPDGADAH